MLMIGVDYHPSFQQIAFCDQETGECGERRLTHSDGEAERFYRELKQRGVSVRVGMEATGYACWFERLLGELNYELWIGNAAEIQSKRVRKQKTDRNDAQLLLQLLLEDRFPRIWVPRPENRDLRQLLWHRHRLVQMRTRILNQLQALAMKEGWRWKKKALQRTGTKGAGETCAGSLGQSTPAGVIEPAGPAESDHRRVNRLGGTRSQKTSGGGAADDASWRRCAHRTGFCADPGEAGEVPMRQADR